MPLRLGILTISDAGSRGERPDASGDHIATWAKERGYTIAERALVPDETDRIGALLANWADGGRADLILTTGGTGLTARDVTPEATRDRAREGSPRHRRGAADERLPSVPAGGALSRTGWRPRAKP